MIQMKVLIAAMTQGALENGGRAQLERLLGAPPVDTDLAALRRLYGESRDQWKPFDDDTILQHLRAPNVQVVSMSNHIASTADPELMDAALTKPDLFILDPLFICFNAGSRLVGALEAAIRAGRKAYCVPLPGGLPALLAERVREGCARELPLLRYAYRLEGRGGWMTRELDDFMATYARARELAQESGPDPQKKAIAEEFFRAAGIELPNLVKPTMAAA